MPSSTFTTFDVFTADLVRGAHSFGTHTFKLLLTNSAPSSSNAVKADITEISAGNGYSAGGPTITMAVTTSGGVAKVTATDSTITASGAIGPFRYAVLYNDTTSSPVKPLVGYLDYGSNLTMGVGDTFTSDFDGSAGLFTV